VALWMLANAGQAAADPVFAPLDQPGPPLSVPQAKLDASLQCSAGVRNATVEPVLLNPATGVTPEQNYSWNWEPALDQLHIPWCAYTAPHNTLDDIQISGEYLVYNIRKMYAMAGRRIAVMGHSQGGMSMRWPLRFWPDTRSMVDDVIGFSGSNHGTTVQPPGGCSSGCPPADWQQFAGSNFIKAINSYAETFPGISYTEVYTHTDEVVQPANNNQDASAALHTGGGQITNIATQDICPLDTNEHNQIGTVDNVAYSLAVDALTHPGPADPSRLDPATVCSRPSMPGVNPANANMWLQILQTAPGLIAVASPVNLVGAPEATQEPPLKCYVFASCRLASRYAPRLHVSVRPRHPHAGKRLLRFHVWVVEGRTRALVGGVRIRLGRHKLRRKTNSHGVLKVRRRLRSHHTYRVVATRTGSAPVPRLLHVGGHAHR
jgi:triacylglycerol esterase/lipase EstA (alpha/beta hydrolase family)